MIQVELTFNQLMIFSPVEELAKTVSFTEGLNVVTSSRVDGNDRGKSVIAKSLYHWQAVLVGAATAERRHSKHMNIGNGGVSLGASYEVYPLGGIL